jgi:hypothetical protein
MNQVDEFMSRLMSNLDGTKDARISELTGELESLRAKLREAEGKLVVSSTGEREQMLGCLRDRDDRLCSAAAAEIEALAAQVEGTQKHLRVLRDLAIAADTAELMIRPYYPGEAASLHAKVKAAKEITDAEICKTCWGHGWIDDDKGGHRCANCSPLPSTKSTSDGGADV